MIDLDRITVLDFDIEAGTVTGQSLQWNDATNTWEANPTTNVFNRITDNISPITADGDIVKNTTGTIGTSSNYWDDIYTTLLQLNTTVSPGSEPAGQIWWNSNDYTMNISTGLGPVLQVGQEEYIIVYNGTGSQIDNGKVVYNIGSFGGRPSVDLANAETHVKISNEVLVATMNIPDTTYGICTKFGKIRNLNTSTFSVGDMLWVHAGAGNDGKLINVKPQFPFYAIQIGIVTVDDVVNGEIIIDIKGVPEDTVINFWNGVFRETFNFLVTSNGTTITGSLSPANGHDDMTMIFSDGFTMLDTNPAKTIILTPGTDTNPQTNYVYIPKSTKVLTLSTSDWPVSTEHIKVAEVVLKTAATTKSDCALRNQNWNDHIEDTTTLLGHLSHIVEKIRRLGAQWYSGIEGSVTINATPTPDDVHVKNTAGFVYQMHKHPFPALDMTQYTIDAVSTGSKTFTISDDGDLTSNFPDNRKIRINNSTGNDGTYTIVSISYSAPDFVITVSETISSAVADGTIGDDIHIVNHFTSPYSTVINLNGQTVDANNVSLSNKSFSFVVWGIQNKGLEVSHLMLNLPTSSYLSSVAAIDDASNYSVYNIPYQFDGVAFLIARFTFSLNAVGNTWILENTQDLRGKVPNMTVG